MTFPEFYPEVSEPDGVPTWQDFQRLAMSDPAARLAEVVTRG